MVNKYSVLLLAFLFYPMMTAQAQSDTLAAIAECKNIADQSRRLACFDNAVRDISAPKKAAKTTVSSASYDCDDLIKDDIDRVTGDRNTVSKETMVVSGDGGLTGLGMYSLMGDNNTIVTIIASAGASRCVEKGNKVNILLRDGSRMELANVNDFNCDSQTTIYFGGYFGKKKELERLSNTEIEVMRVWTSEGYVEEEFTHEQSKQFMHTLACLRN